MAKKKAQQPDVRLETVEMVEGAHFRVCQHHRERFGGRRAPHSKEEADKWIKRRAIQKAAICLYDRFRKPCSKTPIPTLSRFFPSHRL
jgi:hypothetical protein